MPKNKAIYFALLVIAASALLYLAAFFTEYVRPVLPYTTGAGILGLLGAVFYEAQLKKNAAQEQDRQL
ncbi:MAG: hypothetical protein WAO58_06050 [Fimbriimonadaceae bacterium]